MANVLIIEKVAENLFSHTLNDEQAVMDNNPNLTSFLNVDDNTEWLDFKTKNGAPLVKQQRIKPQEITIVDTFGGTGTFTGFTNALAIWTKLAELGYFIGYGISGGGSGVNRFKDLLDIFPQGTYSGQNNKVYVVNESQQRLDATTFYNKRLFSELEDVATGALNTNMAGKILQISIVSGVAKVTLANMPGFSDSLKQTYKLRFSNDDAPDRPTLVSLLNSYTDSPFDNGLVPNDMGGILIEIYDSVTDETLRVYELVEVSAGSSLTEVGDNNLILLTQSSGSIGINEVLQTDSVAVDKTQTFEDSGSDDLMILSPSGIVTTNTTKNTTYEAEGIIHGEGGFVSSDFFETPTQNNARIIPNKSGTYAMTSDIKPRTAFINLGFATTNLAASTAWYVPTRESSNILQNVMIIDSTYNNTTRILSDGRTAGAIIPFNCRIKGIVWSSGSIGTPLTLNIHSWQPSSSTASNNHTVGSKVISATTGGDTFTYSGAEIDTTTILNKNARIAPFLFNNNVATGTLRFNLFLIEIEEVI